MVSRSLKAGLFLLVAAVGWMFSKETLAGLPPLLFLGVRFVLAELVAGLRQLCGHHLPPDQN